MCIVHVSRLESADGAHIHMLVARATVRMLVFG